MAYTIIYIYIYIYILFFFLGGGVVILAIYYKGPQNHVLIIRAPTPCPSGGSKKNPPDIGRGASGSPRIAAGRDKNLPQPGKGFPLRI